MTVARKSADVHELPRAQDEPGTSGPTDDRRIETIGADDDCAAVAVAASAPAALAENAAANTVSDPAGDPAGGDTLAGAAFRSDGRAAALTGASAAYPASVADMAPPENGALTDAPQQGHMTPAPQLAPAPAPKTPALGPSDLAAIMTLPNFLTTVRCILVLVIAVMLLWPWGPPMTAALVLFGIAAATDWLDGQMARAWGLESDLGRMLDHIADKLLVGVTMLCLAANGVIDGLNALAAALILAREIAISGLREHLGSKGVVVPASTIAKWKTTFQLVALAALMAAPLAPFTGVARVAGLLILWIAMAMTIISGAQYVWGTRHVWNAK